MKHNTAPVSAFDDPACNASCLFYPVDDEHLTVAADSLAMTKRQLVAVDLDSSTSTCGDESFSSMQSDSSEQPSVHFRPVKEVAMDEYYFDQEKCSPDATSRKRPAPPTATHRRHCEYMRNVKQPRHGWSKAMQG
ncbi:hypothetical protein MPSEU_000669500 [Mayamaea pseudoterrestris]|nr:hypothetical protein MPSEU_000669500 [Mayamaea pseudoterrestris]